MDKNKKDFINFLIDGKALKFGNFVTKSGRTSPYFINTGSLYRGSDISSLANSYAHVVKERCAEATVLFGPAYKGIPLAVSVTQSLYEKYDMNIAYSFNRKEAKDHAESGIIVGCNPEKKDKVVILDDVITAGTSIRESFALLSSLGSPEVIGIVISVDRKELGKDNINAIKEINENYGVPVYPVVDIDDIIEYITSEKIIDSELEKSVYAYRKQYGI